MSTFVHALDHTSRSDRTMHKDDRISRLRTPNQKPADLQFELPEAARLLEKERIPQALSGSASGGTLHPPCALSAVLLSVMARRSHSLQTRGVRFD